MENRHKILIVEGHATGLLVGIFLSVLVFAMSSIFEESQPPPPAKAESGQVPKQLSPKANREPQGNEKSPGPDSSPVEKHKPEPHGRPHAEQTAPKNYQSPTTWGDPITIFTGVLTVVAVLQLWLMKRQSGIMSDEMQATKTAATAAEQTVDQMRLEQRAWLCGDQIALEPIWSDDKPNCTFTIKNTGSTPGTLCLLGYVFRSAVDEIDAFARAVETVLISVFEPQMVISPGGTLEFRLECPERVAPEILDLSRSNAGHTLILLINFQYEVVHGTRHTTQCAYIFDEEKLNFVMYQEHNYMT